MRKKFRANDLSAFRPEQWAETALMVLEEKMIAARMVHRDFETNFARFGETVNAHRPGEFTARRKARLSDITIQDATAETVPVVLNQHIHVAFAIEDRDLTVSFDDLIPKYIVPAATAHARRLDHMVLGQTHRFRANTVGKLDTAIAKSTIIAADEKLTMLDCPSDGRFALLNPAQKATLIALAEFTEVDKVGNTAGLREASLGRKFGLDLYDVKNVPQIGSTYLPAQVTGAINSAGGYAVGTTTLVVDGFTGDVVPGGSYITIAGEMRPRRVASSTLGSGNTTGIVLSDPLQIAVADNAVITVHGGPLVNLSAGYASGYEESIAYDGAGSGKAPQVGQLISFGTATPEYTVIRVSDNGDGTGSLELDRPLESTVANNARMNLGPSGSYGFAGHRNALALVVRPLKPAYGGGAMSYTAMDSRSGSTMRVSIGYDIKSQKTIVVLDFLAGITVLDTNLGLQIASSDATA